MAACGFSKLIKIPEERFGVHNTGDIRGGLKKKTDNDYESKSLHMQILSSVKVKLGNYLWFAFAPKTSRPGRLYGLPKIHKPAVLIRPVMYHTLVEHTFWHIPQWSNETA